MKKTKWIVYFIDDDDSNKLDDVETLSSKEAALERIKELLDSNDLCSSTRVAQIVEEYTVDVQLKEV